MKVLLINPKNPKTFWSLHHVFTFIPAQAPMPPLGLLTVAAQLPESWSKKLVDLNVEPLTESHLAWADIAMISSMTIQYPSAEKAIKRCKAHGLKVVAGGTHFFHSYEETPLVDHFILGESEEIFPLFLRDLKNGSPQKVYRSDKFPDLGKSPRPLLELINPSDYVQMPIQFSRGCPFNCDFCDVTTQYGKRPRFKTVDQIITELDYIASLGWRGEVFFVDDNFIGAKSEARKLFQAITSWQEEHGYPVWFITQASLNLASDPELLDSMVQAGFKKVFVGIESTCNESLEECHKNQNTRQDLIQAVCRLQGAGLEVLGGFILGFDNDPPSIFQDMVDFIQTTGISGAMVGMLSAPPQTALWRRLESEDRLLGMPSGDNTLDVNALNFVPKMGRDTLVSGYKKVLNQLYSPKAYYQRVLTFFSHYKAFTKLPPPPVTVEEIKSLFRVIWRLGFADQERSSFWSFMAQVVFNYPKLLPEAIIASVCGYHYREISRQFLSQDIEYTGIKIKEPARKVA